MTQRKVVFLNYIKVANASRLIISWLKLKRKIKNKGYKQNLINYIINIRLSEVNTLINSDIASSTR